MHVMLSPACRCSNLREPNLTCVFIGGVTGGRAPVWSTFRARIREITGVWVTIRWNDDWLLQRWDKFTKLFHLVILSYFWMDIQAYLHDEWTALDTADICRNISVWRLTVYWFQSTAIKCLRIPKHALQRYFNGICWWIITLLQALVWFKLVCCIARYLISYIINISIFSY